MNLFSLLLWLVGLAALVYGVVTLVGGNIVLGIVLVVVGLVICAFASGRVRL